jgi:hypothetical protein
MLKNLSIFLVVFSGLLSVKRAVVHNEIETALEVLCSSKLNFQFMEMNFQNERTVSNGQSLEKSSPDYEALCNYGIIADEAA